MTSENEPQERAAFVALCGDVKTLKQRVRRCEILLYLLLSASLASHAIGCAFRATARICPPDAECSTIEIEAETGEEKP